MVEKFNNYSDNLPLKFESWQRIGSFDSDTVTQGLVTLWYHVFIVWDK